MDEQIRQVLLKCLEIDTKIKNDQLSIDLEEWDSLHHIQIVLEIEDKYNLEIPDEDLPLLTSHSDICAYVAIKSGIVELENE
jgi:acyl carrier protein